MRIKTVLTIFILIGMMCFSLCACVDSDSSENLSEGISAKIGQDTEKKVEGTEDDPLKITKDNIDSITPSGYVRVTGEGDVYRTEDGEIYVNDFFSDCGARIHIESKEGMDYTIEAPNASPGKFKKVFSSYPPAAFSGSDVELDGKTYDPCTMTVEGYFDKYMNTEDGLLKTHWYLEDAVVKNIEMNEQ